MCPVRPTLEKEGVLTGAPRYYITTPIYYPSDRLHIGHAYTTTIADSLARWHRLKGEEVFFLTGSDEHGQKIERRAREEGTTPQAYVDGIVATFKDLWRRLDISYDDFIRTTEPRHEAVVQEVFRRLESHGDIYVSQYEGWYCVPCETFWTESRLVEGKCPDCGRDVELLQEESYFFRISRYMPRLLEHIERHPEFIQPEGRRNEMVQFIKGGVEDLCVSRTTFDWGIPVPGHPGHVIYVWIDALTNYITAAGFLDDPERFRRLWPADLHLVGKDILRFHTIIWPAILLALGLPLPRQVGGHGWILTESGKMSKSKGNVTDPIQLIDEFGADRIRYFLLREVPFGQDGVFSREALIERTNADLANDLGNLLHRSLSMLHRYQGGEIREPGSEEPLDRELANLAAGAFGRIDRRLEALALNEALEELWRVVRRGNKYLDQTEPWSLARDPAGAPRLARVLYTVAEALRLVGLLVAPFLPETGRRIWGQLGLGRSPHEAGPDQLAWGLLPAGTRVLPPEPIFPRFEREQEGDGETPARAAAEPSKVPQPEAAQAPAPSAAPGGDGEGPSRSAPGDRDGTTTEATLDDFARLDLRLATVLKAGPVKGADRLLKLQLDLGGEIRQVVAGIARAYRPEELVGRRVVVVANLKPVRLRGELSQGMILAASTPDGALGLVTVDEELPPGSRVK
ncbi:methionine--tRNA ligase [Limnochorda pilosa]|uniref:Methionine--tRNA ligase n=1 Tax=Limnochorda pilosa TaxID=1555112 RepID=A0A0K2SPH1_LIMPI|nr:methionine--tRNA ligase [Limnochorda pilosa]BAS29001.1 methionyl-tRNA synthetase [Limnochorda pilosa]